MTTAKKLDTTASIDTLTQNSSPDDLWEEIQALRTRVKLQQDVNAQFIESSYDGFFDWHIQDDYEYMSPRFWEIFGYTPEEKEHSPSAWQDMIFQEDLEVAMENFEQHVTSKGTYPYRQEVRYRHKDGSTVYVKCRGQVISWDKNGGALRMIGTHTDITPLKNTENKLKNALKNLEKKNAALHDFASLASHDLKEPLRGINSNCYFIFEDYEDELSEGLKSRLDRIQSLSTRMETLVRDILHLSKIDSNENSTSDIKIKDVVNDVKQMFETDIHGQFQINVAESFPTVVYDKTQLREILYNLISNGLKYNTSDTKIITIGYETAANDGLSIYVQDNGIGVEETHYDKIFSMFKRLHQKEAYGGGSGAGLAFVKKIIEENGGKLWIESKPSVGSKIYFTLHSMEPNDGE